MNGKEQLVKVEEMVGKELQRIFNSDKPPETVTVNGQSLRMSCIQLISPEDVWWKNDEVSQRSHARLRCRFCLIVNPAGSTCSCLDSNRKTVSETMQEIMDRPQLSPEQLKGGMIRAIKVAITYPQVTFNTPFIKGYMIRHGIVENEVIQ